MIRRALPFLIATLLPQTLAAQDVTSFAPALEGWYAKASRQAPGQWGVVVAGQDGRILWSVNAEQPLIPASTVKLLTTGFARTVVGPDARRATRVVGTGHVNPTSGTWEGRWALELNGDMTLDRPDRAGGPTLAALAQQLSAIGVRRLIGPLTVTTSAGEPRSIFPAVWASRHRGRTYAPLIGPVALNENVIEFTAIPGAKAGRPVTIAGDAPTGIASLVKNSAKTVSGSRSRLALRALPGGKYQLTGTIGTRAGARRMVSTATDANAVLEAVWLRATQLAGIEWVRSASAIGAAIPGDRRVLAEIASQPFDSIAHEVNTRSLNIGAELMLLWGGGPDRAAERLNQHVRTVTGMSEGFHLVDGSGLSSDDRVAPLVFTTYLSRFPQTAAGRNFPLLLPANGSGTLRSLASGLPAPGVVRAKTGTLGNVSSLVGYLGSGQGTLLIAAIYNGGAVGSAKQAQWNLFRLLGANGVVIPPDAPAGTETALGGPSLTPP